MIDAFKYHEQLKRFLSSKSIGKRDFKTYLISLAELTGSISKDANSYTFVSPIIKKWTAAFKTIFGNRKINLYASIITVLYSKILRFYREFEPDHSYECYREWRNIIASSNSDKRAEAFIKDIRRFEFVVVQLLVAENRWFQLVILELLRLYTKTVKLEDIIKLNLKGCDKFLDIIKKVVSLSQHHQLSVRDTNAFLSDINNTGNEIISFQPSKIICENVTFILTDYELWLDFNLKNKQITFVALSTDKKESVYGAASTIGNQIVANEETIVIKAHWHLQNEYMSVNKQTQIVFSFSSRVHNSILDSKLKNVFDIVSHQPILKKNSFLPTAVGVNTTRMADESMFSSLHEIGLGGNAQLQMTSIQPSSKCEQEKIINQDIAKDTKQHDENDLGRSFEQENKIQTVKATENSCNFKLGNAVSLEKEDSKIGMKDQCEASKADRQCVKKKIRKRRKHVVKDTHSTSSDNECNKLNKYETFRRNKRVRGEIQTRRKTVDKSHFYKKPHYKEDERNKDRNASNHIVKESTMPQVSSKVVKANTPISMMQKPVLHSPNDEKCIRNTPKEVLISGDYTTTAENKKVSGNNFIEPNTCDVEPKIQEAQVLNTEKRNVLQNRRNTISFDKEFLKKYNQKGWHIRHFFETLLTEEQEDIEEVIIIDDMDSDMDSAIEIEDFYESVSQAIPNVRV